MMSSLNSLLTTVYATYPDLCAEMCSSQRERIVSVEEITEREMSIYTQKQQTRNSIKRAKTVLAQLEQGLEQDLDNSLRAEIEEMISDQRGTLRELRLANENLCDELKQTQVEYHFATEKKREAVLRASDLVAYVVANHATDAGDESDAQLLRALQAGLYEREKCLAQHVNGYRNPAVAYLSETRDKLMNTRRTLEKQRAEANTKLQSISGVNVNAENSLQFGRDLKSEAEGLLGELKKLDYQVRYIERVYEDTEAQLERAIQSEFVKTSPSPSPTASPTFKSMPTPKSQRVRISLADNQVAYLYNVLPVSSSIFAAPSHSLQPAC